MNSLESTIVHQLGHESMSILTFKPWKFFEILSNSAKDINAMKDVLDVIEKERRFVPKILGFNRSLAGEKGEPDGMPYNSDHGPFVYDLPDGVTGTLVCYGSGSYEYHTYADTMDRFNEESLGVSVIAYGTYIRHLAWPVFE